MSQPLQESHLQPEHEPVQTCHEVNAPDNAPAFQ